jgi:hypothetical protein
MSEHDEQAALFTWANYQANTMPELQLLYAIPNGGHRYKAVAVKLEAEGVKSGVPDVCLPVARSGYHGLYIEMKYGKNKPSDNQIAWLKALAGQGYKTAVCWGFEEAKTIVEAYLNGR